MSILLILDNMFYWPVTVIHLDFNLLNMTKILSQLIGIDSMNPL